MAEALGEFRERFGEGWLLEAATDCGSVLARNEVLAFRGRGELNIDM